MPENLEVLEQLVRDWEEHDRVSSIGYGAVLGLLAIVEALWAIHDELGEIS